MSSLAAKRDDPVGMTPWLYAMLFTAFPIASGISTMLGRSDENRSLTIAARLLFTGLCSVVLLLTVLRAPQRFYRGPYWYPLITVWVALLCRLCWDTLVVPVPYELFWSVPQIYTFAFAVCIIPMLAFLVIPNARALETALIATYAMVTFTCPFVFLTNYSQPTQQSFRFQPNAFNGIAYGHLGATVVLLAAYIATQPRAAKLLRLSLLVAIPIGIVTICIAASRGPMISLLACCLLLVFTRVKVSQFFSNLLVLAVIFAGFVWIGTRVESDLDFSLSARFQKHMDEGFEGDERVDLYRNAIEQFLGSPFVGNALVEETTHMYAHNCVIECFMATGLVGGVAFCVVAFMAGRAAIRLLRLPAAPGWVGLVFIQYFIAGLFSSTVFGDGELWCLAGAVIALEQAGQPVGARGGMAYLASGLVPRPPRQSARGG